MLNIEQISSQYPDYINKSPKHILREYLQYKILDIVFKSKHAAKLSFIGGTALRIVYNNTRFSEDLDFDNFNLNEQEFEEVTKLVKKGLEEEGYKVELKNVFKGAFRCYIRMPEILFDNSLSPYHEEKIVIQIDTAPHHFRYTPDKKTIKKFDILTDINVTPMDILLSQKIVAAFNRKRIQGRDFFDIIFLLSLNAKPNFSYLEQKLEINNAEQLKKYVELKSKDIDFKKISTDVAHYVFFTKDVNKILDFKKYVEEYL